MILGISTSQSNISLVLGENKQIKHRSEHSIMPNSREDIGDLLRLALDELNIKASEITSIIVDIGPGGTSSVRTGVAFGNGLSYSLKIPILPVTSIELIGIDVFRQLKIPVVAIFPSIKGNYYYGFYDGKTVRIQYGQIETIAAKIDEQFTKIAIAGYGKALPILPNYLERCNCQQSGIQKVNPALMIENVALFSQTFTNYPNLPVPITELTI